MLQLPALSTPQQTASSAWRWNSVLVYGSARNQITQPIFPTARKMRRPYLSERRPTIGARKVLRKLLIWSLRLFAMAITIGMVRPAAGLAAALQSSM